MNFCEKFKFKLETLCLERTDILTLTYIITEETFRLFYLVSTVSKLTAQSIPSLKYVGLSAISLFYSIFVWILTPDLYTNIKQLNVFILVFNILMNCVFQNCQIRV